MTTLGIWPAGCEIIIVDDDDVVVVVVVVVVVGSVTGVAMTEGQRVMDAGTAVMMAGFWGMLAAQMPVK